MVFAPVFSLKRGCRTSDGGTVFGTYLRTGRILRRAAPSLRELYWARLEIQPTKPSGCRCSTGEIARLAWTWLEVSGLDLLVVPALGTGEGAHLARAVCRHDGGLVPVEDVSARLAPLPEGNDRAALVDDLAPCHLYRHLAEVLARADPLVALPPKEPAPQRTYWVCGRRRPVAWF